MPERNIRPEVVALYTDLDMTGGHPDTWRHKNGSDLTGDERRLAMSATAPELEAAANYLATVRDYYAEPLLAVTKVAEHIAHHFAIEPITLDLRESDLSLSESEWRPAVTAQELMDALDHSLEVAKTIPDNTPILIAQYPTVINEDGEETYVELDKLADGDNTDEQTNAVLVLLAEHVALKKAADDALLRAIALREHLDLY